MYQIHVDNIVFVLLLQFKFLTFFFTAHILCRSISPEIVKKEKTSYLLVFLNGNTSLYSYTAPHAPEALVFLFYFYLPFILKKKRSEQNITVLLTQ